MIKNAVILNICALLLITYVTPAQADISNYALSFGPYVGGGTQSNGAQVRHSSGFKVGLARRFVLGQTMTIGPEIQVGNGLVNSKKYEGGHKTISNYDNRFFVGGVRLGKLYGSDTLTDEAYVSVLGGFAQSKLNEEESAGNTFIQKDYHQIQGRYGVAELGTRIQLRRNFSVDLAMVGHYYRAEQENASGNIDGTVSNDEGTFELNEREEKDRYDNLARILIQRSVAATVGVSLGF